MEVTVLVWDQLESDTVEWVFRVNGNGYIETVVEGMVMDIFYELGEVFDTAGLIDHVENLMALWRLKWQTVIV